MPIIPLNSEVINAQSVIGETLFGGTSLSSRDASRIPMVFTSTKRLRLINPDYSVRVLSDGRRANSSLASDISSLSRSGDITLVQSELAAIQMAVNPNSISWKQSKRITKRDTQEGSIFFHFTNARGQNNDILTLDFRGNTGNIDRISDLSPTTTGTGILNASGESTGAMNKLLIWHNLWNLTREQMLLDDNTKNEFLITYTSAAIPSEIMLIGFFSSTLEWEDSAEKPNSKDYTFSFTIDEIIPDIDEIIKEVQTVFTDVTPTVSP
jgi:hypothetical protein